MATSDIRFTSVMISLYPTFVSQLDTDLWLQLTKALHRFLMLYHLLSVYEHSSMDLMTMFSWDYWGFNVWKHFHKMCDLGLYYSWAEKNTGQQRRQNTPQLPQEDYFTSIFNFFAVANWIKLRSYVYIVFILVSEICSPVIKYMEHVFPPKIERLFW